MAKSKQGKRPLAGLWRWYEQQPAMGDILKVKAQLKPEDAPEGPERAAVLGNGLADTHA